MPDRRLLARTVRGPWGALGVVLLLAEVVARWDLSWDSGRGSGGRPTDASAQAPSPSRGLLAVSPATCWPWET